MSWTFSHDFKLSFCFEVRPHWFFNKKKQGKVRVLSFQFIIHTKAISSHPFFRHPMWIMTCFSSRQYKAWQSIMAHVQCYRQATHCTVKQKNAVIRCAVLLEVTHWITGGIPIQMSTWETLKIGKILKQKWRLKSGYVLSRVHWLGNNIWPKDNTEFLQFALGSWSRQGQESLPSQWFVFRKPWARLPR